VIRRPTGLTGGSGNFNINLRELQTWVNGVNIKINNGLTSYFALWTDKETDIGFFSTNSPNIIYNNIIETDFGTTSVLDSTSEVALIIQNIPLTAIDDIQALVLYNMAVAPFSLRTIGLAIELYNSINDPDLNLILANTNVITTDALSYRFDFPSLSTYTAFVGVDSITNIVNNTFALAEDAIFTDYDFNITGDIVISGSITASNKYFYEADEVVKAFGLYGSSLHYYQVEDDLNTFINSGVIEGDTIMFSSGSLAGNILMEDVRSVSFVGIPNGTNFQELWI
jgi:hypothetical protein